MTDAEAPLQWRLLASMHDAGAALCGAEAQLLAVEGKLNKLDAIIARVRGLAADAGIELSTEQSPDPATFLPIQAFAQRVGWGTKRMRQLVRDHMTEGEHFHRNGTRYVIHAEPAEQFLKSFSASRHSHPSSEQLLVDEVTRRRALAAKRRVG